MNHFFSELFLSACWMTASIGVAEFARDIWHAFCHFNYWLYKHFHRWHHIAYGRNFVKTSEALWRKAEWRHGIPETSIMLLSTVIFWYAANWISNGWCVKGALAGILFSARLQLFVILRGLGFFTKVDKHHLTEPFDIPPSIGKINIAYHYKHHFVDVNAYFGAIYTLIDQILGTALSFSRIKVTLNGLSSEWTTAIANALKSNNASILENIDLDSTDILILGNGDYSLIRSFFSTVNSNRDVACKELWWVSFPSTPTLPDWVISEAPCTIRSIDIFSEKGMPTPGIIKFLLFQAKRHVQHIVLTHDPFLALLYRLHVRFNLFWEAYTQRFSLNNCHDTTNTIEMT